MFDVAGLSMFPNEAHLLFYLLGLCNSKVALHFANILSPTMNYEVGHIASFPLVVQDEEHIANMSKKCVEIAKNDWNDQETSWDFKNHPLIVKTNKIEEAYLAWKETSLQRIQDIKEMEEAINTSLAEIYGLEEEIIVKVEDKDITLHLPDINEDIKSFISYAVGCMFGRFSLDVPGIAYGGGIWDSTVYITFRPDKDAIIPICDDEYFEDDILGRFVSFVEKAFGKETLEENLRFIADALGGKGSSREVIRNYFINDFYADHLKMYQKRPIYWLFDSGKKNGFKCLIYMHRYQPDTIARIRTDYVHEQQSRYRTAIADLENRIASAGTGERVKLSKKLTKLQDQAEELRVYEEKIHHLADQMIPIDLDDGVKVNYARFQDVLAKIK